MAFLAHKNCKKNWLKQYEPIFIEILGLNEAEHNIYNIQQIARYEIARTFSVLCSFFVMLEPSIKERKRSYWKVRNHYFAHY